MGSVVWRSIPTVLTVEELLDKSYSRAKKAANQVVDKDRIFRTRKQMTRMIQSAGDNLSSTLLDWVHRWPSLDQMSPFDVAFLSVTSEPDTEMLKSESTPTVKPVSFSTPKVAEVVSFASDLKNDALSILSNVSALVAVPCILYPVARLSPSPIDVEPNPEGAVLAVNAVVEPIANLVPLLYSPITFCEPAELSVIVSCK